MKPRAILNSNRCYKGTVILRKGYVSYEKATEVVVYSIVNDIKMKMK